jgi:glucose-6-phosphate isomerase, archaeal
VRDHQSFCPLQALTVMSLILESERLSAAIDTARGSLGNAPIVSRYLGDLRGCFQDSAAFEQELTRGNPLVYTVAALEMGSGEGDLHFGLGTVYPGRIGEEYFLTKGHLHTWRAAAELYIGLTGQGAMLLQDEASGEAVMLPLRSNSIVYVPGYTAHRTVNTGGEPLVYLGVYPARAGHDYEPVARRNFRNVVVLRDGQPCLLQRSEL